MKLKTKIILATLLAPLLSLMLIAIHLSVVIFLPTETKSNLITINPGEGFSTINSRLYKEEFISNPRVFYYFAKYKNALTKFKAGTFEVPKSINMNDLLDLLTNGTPLLISVTIPEGKNIYEIGKILEEKNITTYASFIESARSTEMRNKLWGEAPSVEGYLFPETYKFAPNSPSKNIIEAMMNEFFKKASSLDFTKTNLSKHETIILASIVEKETGAKFERPLIASVYLNRLKKKMRLQADPTTIYGIYENYDGNLKKSHLLEVTDYNTYKLPALPLGPIANPSLEAIKAVLEPKDSQYIFFVSKNDGTHIFTENYKDHLKAVEFWQKNKANREGKSWRDLSIRNGSQHQNNP